MDLEKFNGDSSWELPVPARYVIDRRNVIRSADLNYDYTFRPEPAETLAVLRNLQSAISQGQ